MRPGSVATQSLQFLRILQRSAGYKNKKQKEKRKKEIIILIFSAKGGTALGGNFYLPEMLCIQSRHAF
jgi:hypothetical protein